MRIALGQFNPVVGDLVGNAEKMKAMYLRAYSLESDLLIFPELAICGYPPEDLLLKNHFLEDMQLALQKFAADCNKKTIIAGFAEKKGAKIYNSAAVLQAGQKKEVYRKVLLPNYGVFDEQRYFEAGDKPLVIELEGFNVALTVCRDIWDLDRLTDFLNPDKSGRPIHIIVNISASPFHMGKIEQRIDVISQCAKKFNSAVCYCNLVGGQDEIVFDGASIIADQAGNIIAQAKAFEEDLLIADIDMVGDKKIRIKPLNLVKLYPADDVEQVYKALVLGTRDYTCKNGFDKVLLGLSGGIDSSVVAAIAVAALGPENVIGVTMPSRFSSSGTRKDAEKLAENLGIKILTIPIEPILEQFDRALHIVDGWDNKGIAYENLQARIRGSLLMSISNKFGYLVLTTGNKSEIAVGYCTLYGDTAGGFAVIKDVPKTLIYKLADYINKISGSVIPADVLTRPPSAELRPDQKDTDSLPDYDVLDEILKRYVEQDKSAQHIIKDGFDADIVRWVIRMVDRNEYKRRQSPPGVKITSKAFGKDRRLPITNRYETF